MQIQYLGLEPVAPVSSLMRALSVRSHREVGKVVRAIRASSDALRSLMVFSCKRFRRVAN